MGCLGESYIPSHTRTAVFPLLVSQYNPSKVPKLSSFFIIPLGSEMVSTVWEGYFIFFFENRGPKLLYTMILLSQPPKHLRLQTHIITPR